MLNVKVCLFHVFKMEERDVEDSCQCFKSQGNREVKHDVYGKRQTAKIKLLLSVHSTYKLSLKGSKSAHFSPSIRGFPMLKHLSRRV